MSIRIVADFGTQIFQFKMKLNRGTTPEFNTISAIIFIHCCAALKNKQYNNQLSKLTFLASFDNLITFGNIEKYYIVYTGLLNVLIGREKTADRGHILKNVVYLELLRRGYKIWTGRLRNAEGDFTIKNRNGEIEYYQCSWEILNKETQKREFAPLEAIKGNYPKYLLTTDSFTQNKSGIVHKNVLEWIVVKYELISVSKKTPHFRKMVVRNRQGRGERNLKIRSLLL